MSIIISRNHIVEHITLRDGSLGVKKTPRSENALSLSRAYASIIFFQTYFQGLIVPTVITAKSFGRYEIYQRYVGNMTLDEYFSTNATPDSVIIGTLQEFMRRANRVYEETGITFDIVGKSQNGPNDSFLGATNFVLDIHGKPIFVDTVDTTNSINQSPFVNKFASTFLPGRRKRKELLDKLTEEAFSWKSED